jgi:hypothetical protein
VAQFTPDIFIAGPKSGIDSKVAGILADSPCRDWSHLADFPGLDEIIRSLVERHPQHGETQWQPPSP